MTSLHEAAVVPIALRISGKVGYTIWAPPWMEDGEEWQAFLGASGRVWLFESLEDLAMMLASGAENDLTEHPGWAMLQTLPAEQLHPDGDYRFDLDAVPALTEAEVAPDLVDEVGEAVELVERIAECCDHQVLLRLMEQPGFADLLGTGDDSGEGEDDSFDVGEEEGAAAGDGDDAWGEIGRAIRTAWPMLLGRLDECLEWRTAADVPATTPGAERMPVTPQRFWDEVGILPVKLRLPERTGYTLRCYVDDEPRFLGRDLAVDVFDDPAALAAFCQGDDEHDLTQLETWRLVHEAPLLELPEELFDTLDLAAVATQLATDAAKVDAELLATAAEAAQDLANYCRLEAALVALAPDQPLGAALAAAADGADAPAGSDPATVTRQWRELLTEVAGCLRWHG